MEHEFVNDLESAPVGGNEKRDEHGRKLGMMENGSFELCNEQAEASVESLQEKITISSTAPPALPSPEQNPTNTWPPSFETLFSVYVKKFDGVPGKTPPDMITPLEMCISSLLAFIGIFLIAVTDNFYLLPSFSAGHNPDLGIQMLTGAYAATSVLIYEVHHSPLSQPRNVLGSCTICSFLGVSTRLVCDIIGIPRYATGALAVAIGILGMNLTKTLHPPGACALIAVIGGEMIEDIGYGYMLTSIGAAFIMLCVAILGNNLFPSRQYPLYWT